MPGLLCYLPSRDAVVVANSNLELECYNFGSLQAMTDNKVDASRQNQDESNMRVKPEWKCNLGEQAGHCFVMMNRYSRQYDLTVTGDHTLFVINERGEIRYQRRLEYTPSCV